MDEAAVGIVSDALKAVLAGGQTKVSSSLRGRGQVGPQQQQIWQELLVRSYLWPWRYLLGKVAGPIGRVQDLVVEDGKVQGQPQSDGVRRLHFGPGYVKCLLVGLLGVVHITLHRDREVWRQNRSY